MNNADITLNHELRYKRLINYTTSLSNTYLCFQQTVPDLSMVPDLEVRSKVVGSIPAMTSIFQPRLQKSTRHPQSG